MSSMAPFHCFPKATCKPRLLRQPGRFGCLAAAPRLPSTFPVRKGQEQSHSRLSPVSTWLKQLETSLLFHSVVSFDYLGGTGRSQFFYSLVATVPVALYFYIKQFEPNVRKLHGTFGASAPWATREASNESENCPIPCLPCFPLCQIIHLFVSKEYFSVFKHRASSKRSDASFLDTRSDICKQTLVFHFIF